MTMQKDDVTGRAFSISCIIVLSSLSPSPPIRLDNGGCTGHLLILTTRVGSICNLEEFFCTFRNCLPETLFMFWRGFSSHKKGCE